MANDLGARLFDITFGGSRQGLGGWSAFLAFLIMVVQIVMIILRFLNFAASFWYPLFALVLVSAVSARLCVALCVRGSVASIVFNSQVCVCLCPSPPPPPSPP